MSVKSRHILNLRCILIMNNTTIKTWTVLLALLAVTLILVWQAPPLEQETEVLPATQDFSQPVRSILPFQQQSTDDNIVLEQRQIVTEKTNLFDIPQKKQPVIVARKQVVTPPLAQVQIPFRYIGMLEENKVITLFLMEGRTLYQANEGDVINKHFQLQHVDMVNKQLVWLYLPNNETLKMSIEK